MNHSQLYDTAQDLAAGRTPLSLARELLGVRAELSRLRDEHAQKTQRAVMQARKEWALQGSQPVNDELRGTIAERDALAAYIMRFEEAARGGWSDILTVMEDSPATSLARLKAEAMREVAGWMETGGPTLHEAEMIGMEISGPTSCSAAKRCLRAGKRAFLEAARIFDHIAEEDKP